MEIHKKIVTDENGNPSDVIIPWDEYKQIEEILGIDLDEETKRDLRLAHKGREENGISDYIALDDI
ncbi:MAG: hypothetical protein HOM08_13365 [Candidatus Marinimicrobia bacterium]|nr:hypothetical protein [Candidatus Neomarinimicrobiota bacterium]